MKTNRIPGLFIGLVLQFTVATTAFAVPFTNGDFAAGFGGWKGQVDDIFLFTTPVDPLPGGFPGNFDATTGAAVLTTSTLVDDIFSVFMFQTFDLPAIAPGETVILSYDLAVTVTDLDPIFGDLAFAQIADVPGFSNAIDLLGGSSRDVTALAGQTVELLFGIQDFDGGIVCFVDCNDVLSIDNIVFQVIAAATPTPTPASLALLALALAAMGAARAARRRAGETTLGFNDAWTLRC